jgi:hypothetical protein
LTRIAKGSCFGFLVADKESPADVRGSIG